MVGWSVGWSKGAPKEIPQLQKHWCSGMFLKSLNVSGGFAYTVFVFHLIELYNRLSKAVVEWLQMNKNCFRLP